MSKAHFSEEFAFKNLPRLKLYFGGLGDLGLGGSELVEIGRLDGDVKSDL